MEPASLKTFLRAFGGNWLEIMSGAASVPFAAAALFSPTQYGQVLFAAASIFCAWFAAYKLWAIERTAKNIAEEALRPTMNLVEVKETRRTFENSMHQSFSLVVQNIGRAALSNCLIKVDEWRRPDGALVPFNPTALKTVAQGLQNRAGPFKLRGQEKKEVLLCTTSVSPGDTFLWVAVHYETMPATFYPADQNELLLGLYSEGSPEFVRLRFGRLPDGGLQVSRI